jgi:hypothetical protein
MLAQLERFKAYRGPATPDVMAQEASAMAEDGSAAVNALTCKSELLDDHNGDHQGRRGRLAATKGCLKPPANISEAAQKRRGALVASAAFWGRLVYN